MALPEGVGRYITDPDDLAAFEEIVEALQVADVWTALETYETLDEIWSTEHGGQFYDPFRAALGLCDRYYLLVILCGRTDFIRPNENGTEWLYDRCRQVEAEPDGYLDLWAREHYKSTIITFGGILQQVLRDPEVTIGIFSHTKDVARKFLGQIKLEMESNVLLKRLYHDVLWAEPKKQAPVWALDKGLCLKRQSNPKEQTIEAHGLIDGMPTGAHFMGLVYDDVVTREAVTTATQIQKTTECFELSTNLGAHGGWRWYIGTRYHMADTYHTMLANGSVKPRIFPATDNGRKDGNPVFLTPEQWETKKRDQPTQIAAQMLQNPAAGTEKLFEIQRFRRWEVRPRTLRVFILVDPAKGPAHKEVGRDRDRTAIAVIGVDSASNKYLLDGFRHRLTLAERWAAIKNLRAKWMRMRGVVSVQIGYERYGLQSDIEHFHEMMRIERNWFEVQEVNWPREGPGAKTDRIQRLVPDLHYGRFMLPAFVHHPGKGQCYWLVKTDAQDQAPEAQGIQLGEVYYLKHPDPTPRMRRCIDEGSPDLVCAPIKRIDENKVVYDLTTDFLEEATFFPFALHDDLLDACSRIYDMEPTPPRHVEPSMLEPPVYEDGI